MADKSVLSSIKLGPYQLKNRVVMAPMTRARAGPSRIPNDLMVEHFSQRASAGLIIVDATAISEQGYGWFGAPANYTEEHCQGWKKVVDAVHQKGGIIYLQLWHMGRQADPSFNSKNEIVSSSAVKLQGQTRNIKGEKNDYVVPRSLELDEIKGVVEDYKKSAELALKAGFDGVEIHAANGYLIDQFIQTCVNQRTDEYGGSIENRSRFLLEIVEAIKQVYSADKIGVRLSPNGVYGGMGSEDNHLIFPYIATQLNNHKLGYLHVMDGIGFGAHDKCRLLTLFDFKKVFDGVVIGNVGYTKQTADGAIRSGAADMIAFGRPYISNPDLVERFTNDWPLAKEASYEDYYATLKGSQGYNDYTVFKETKSKTCNIC